MELLRSVDASFHSVNKFATANLSLLKAENCESHCGVPSFSDLLDSRVTENCGGVHAAEVKRCEVNGVQLRKSDLWKFELGELVERQLLDSRNGDLGKVDIGERDTGQLRHGFSVTRGANSCKHSAICRMSQGLGVTASGGLKPRTSLAWACQSLRFPLPSPPWWPSWSSTSRATG